MKTMTPIDYYTNEREARALLSYLTEPGDFFVGHLVDQYGVFTAINGLLHEAWDQPNNTSIYLKFEREQVEKARGRLLARFSGLYPMKRTLDAFEQVERIRFMIPGDVGYPYRLADLGHGQPFGLWVRGTVNADTFTNSVAIVGARAATSYGEHVTSALATGLGDNGLTIVSGAAYGIDGAAHRAALSMGARTVAFLAGGVDRAYPAGHTDLIDRIAITGGAVISEVAPGSTPTRWRFLQRNRLIAASTQGLVVVEAGARSGSLNAAGHASSLARPVMAVPGPVTSAASLGCHALIRDRKARLVTSTEDVLANIR